MSYFTSRTASLIQNYYSSTKKYSPKTLFELSALESFKHFTRLKYGFAKLVTNTIELIPVQVQKTLYKHLNNM